MIKNRILYCLATRDGQFVSFCSFGIEKSKTDGLVSLLQFVFASFLTAKTTKSSRFWLGFFSRFFFAVFLMKTAKTGNFLSICMIRFCTANAPDPTKTLVFRAGNRKLRRHGHPYSQSKLLKHLRGSMDQLNISIFFDLIMDIVM